jgi:hypothetical protein
MLDDALRFSMHATSHRTAVASDWSIDSTPAPQAGRECKPFQQDFRQGVFRNRTAMFET